MKLSEGIGLLKFLARAGQLDRVAKTLTEAAEVVRDMAAGLYAEKRVEFSSLLGAARFFAAAAGQNRAYIPCALLHALHHGLHYPYELELPDPEYLAEMIREVTDEETDRNTGPYPLTEIQVWNGPAGWEFAWFAGPPATWHLKEGEEQRVLKYPTVITLRCPTQQQRFSETAGGVAPPYEVVITGRPEAVERRSRCGERADLHWRLWTPIWSQDCSECTYDLEERRNLPQEEKLRRLEEYLQARWGGPQGVPDDYVDRPLFEASQYLTPKEAADWLAGLRPDLEEKIRASARYSCTP